MTRRQPRRCSRKPAKSGNSAWAFLLNDASRYESSLRLRRALTMTATNGILIGWPGPRTSASRLARSSGSPGADGMSTYPNGAADALSAADIDGVGAAMNRPSCARSRSFGCAIVTTKALPPANAATRLADGPYPFEVQVRSSRTVEYSSSLVTLTARTTPLFSSASSGAGWHANQSAVSGLLLKSISRVGSP